MSVPAGTTIVAGSIATDHLMHFPGRFAEQFVDGHLDRLSLSFLVDDLVVRRGGVGANIAFGMGVLGRRPVLVGAVGTDFAEHRGWLEDHGVDCGSVLTVESTRSPRFTCITDDDQCQLASFYPGAMTAAGTIALAPIVARNGIGLVVVGSSDPASMLAHTEQARALGVAFAADPSQQLPGLDRDQCRGLVDGATYLFSNAYEWELIIRRTGWDADEVTARVGLRITTLGADGVRIVGRDGTDLHVGVVPAREVVDPTGVGDAFRAGFLTGTDHGLTVERAAQLGSLVATLALETDGAQEWRIDPDTDLARLRAAHGARATDDIAPVLRAALHRAGPANDSRAAAPGDEDRAGGDPS